MTTVTVTAEHIAGGEPENCNYCPVALAIWSAFPFPGIADVAVGPDEIGIQPATGGPWIELEPPRDVVLFMALFDATRAGEPFTFELDYPAVT